MIDQTLLEMKLVRQKKSRFFLRTLCQLSYQLELWQVRQQAAGWMADFHCNMAAKSKFDEDFLG